MKIKFLLFVFCISSFAYAEDSDFNTDLNNIKQLKQEMKSKFEQKFNEDYAGFYVLNASKNCSLDSNVKKVKLNLKENKGNHAIRAIFYDDKDQILENKFYPLSKAKVSDQKSPSKDSTYLLWESAIQKDDMVKTKFERISFAKEVVSFDVDRWIGGESFFDKLLISSKLEKSSKCNFTKIDTSTKKIPSQWTEPTRTFKGSR